MLVHIAQLPCNMGLGNPLPYTVIDIGAPGDTRSREVPVTWSVAWRG